MKRKIPIIPYKLSSNAIRHALVEIHPTVLVPECEPQFYMAYFTDGEFVPGASDIGSL